MWSRFTKLVAVSLSFLSLNCASYTNCIGLESLKDSILNITHKHNKTVLPYDSFVKLEKRYFDKDKNYYFSTFASGTIVKQTEKTTVILTAKHFCDDTDETKEAPKELLPLFSATGIWDEKQELHFSMFEVVDKDFDLCLIETDTKINQSFVSLSPILPQRGEKVFNISGPLGLSNGTTVLLFEGYYAGDLVYNEKEYVSLYTIPVTNGSSGSAVLNEHGEVIGVIYAVMKDFNHVSMVVPYLQVKRFLQENHILN